MKKLFTLMFVLATMLTGTNNAYAYSFKVDDLCYNIISISDVTCAVTKGDTKYKGDIIIPSTVEYNGFTFSVIEIEAEAFSECKSLTSVDMPETIITIGNNAFEKCVALSAVTIPSLVKKIDSEAFSRCASLKTVEILGPVVEICDRAFYDCKSLFSINLPETLETIGNFAFSGCEWIVTIDIPEEVSYIGNYAFSGCKLLTSIKIPEKVETICEYVFSECESLVSVKLGQNVRGINCDAFSNCSSLKSIEIPPLVKKIGNYSFMGCKSLESIEINSVKSIGVGAFMGCAALKNVELSDSITGIYKDTFAGCKSLTSIELPPLVGCIAEYAFSGCSSLQSIEMPDSVKSIGECAFRLCTSLSSASLGDYVRSISEHAFYGCSSLTTISIPNSVVYLGYEAFSGCTSLETVYLDCPLSEYGRYGGIFTSCTSLKEAILTDSVPCVGAGWFIDCSSLHNVKLGSSISSIERYAFSGCSSLSTIKIPGSVSKIEENAFSNCLELQSIYLEGENPPVLYKVSGFNAEQYETIQVYVPMGSLAIYQTDPEWGKFLNLQEYDYIPEDPKKENVIQWDQNLDNVFVGENIELTATTTSGLPVSYEITSGSSFASIEGNTLHALAAGEVSITASQAGNEEYNAAANVTKTFTIKENPIQAESIILSPNELCITVGESALITAEVFPKDIIDPEIQWKSESENIATVADGVVVGVSVGTTIITASYANVSATCEVRVVSNELKTQTIIWSQDLNNVYDGQTVVLSAYATSGLPISYEIIEGNNNAILDGNMLTAICPGQVTIEANQAGNAEYAAAQSFTRTFNIKIMVPEAIELSETTLHLTVGEQATLTFKLTPDFPDLLPQIEWSVSNPDIAAVDNGVVTAISSGNASITATCGSISATCEVIVDKLPQIIIWSQSFNDVHEGDLIELMASASSGLPVEYQIVEGNVSLEGNMLEIISAGNVAIKATQPGNEIYEAAEPFTVNFSVLSGIANINTDNIVVSVENNILNVKGLAKGQEYMVHNPAGMLVYRGADDSLTLTSGVYIVTVDGKRPQRVIVR